MDEWKLEEELKNPEILPTNKEQADPLTMSKFRNW
jgi:hypothetical protein